MYISSLLGLLAVASTTTNAQGCYSDGMQFKQLNGGDVEDVIKNFCRERVPQNFEKLKTVVHCYPFPEDNQGDRVEMSIENKQRGPQGMSFEECFANFQPKYHGCPSGGKGIEGGFHYKIDPNRGPCKSKPGA